MRTQQCEVEGYSMSWMVLVYINVGVIVDV